MGPRYTNAIRQDVSLNWALVITTVFNLVSGLKPYLLTRISYMLVCNVATKVRKGFSQTYLYPKSEYDLFAAGRHAEMQHYVKGYLGTLAAIRKAPVG